MAVEKIISMLFELDTISICFFLIADHVAFTIMAHSTMMRLNLNYHDQEVLASQARSLALQCTTKVNFDWVFCVVEYYHNINSVESKILFVNI